MKRIMFVDDDPNVLSGLEHMLHKMRDEWEMMFAKDGDEALALLKSQPFDAVISDMRMPAMTGAQLLRKVRDRYPGTVRFILSGHSDHELIMQSVGLAHQYLAKPCDPDVLIAAIRNPFALREMLSDEGLRSKIAEISSLPTLPDIYRKLVEALGSESTPLETVAKIIGEDVGMTAKVLQLVNSSFFGSPTHVGSPLRAVSFLGLETVRTLTLTAGIFDQFRISTLEGISLENVYSHSMAVGTTSQKIARKLNLDKRIVDDALVGGMMHDIGKPIMLMHFRDKLRASIRLSGQKSIPLSEAEEEIFGVSHAAIGAYLLSLWGEPDSIVEAVALHHCPSQSTSRVPNALSAVHIANALHSRDGFVDIDEWESATLDKDYLCRLGIADQVSELIKKYLAETTV